MIEKLLRKFGYFPTSEVERARYEGRIDGQKEVMGMCRSRVESVRLQYSGIERHRDALIKLIADGRALQPPPPIIIKNGALVSGRHKS